MVADYAEDAVFVAYGQIGRGRDYLRAVFAQVLAGSGPDLLGMGPEVTTIERDEVIFASWRTTAAEPPHLTGADTFVIVDGRITVHTGFVASTTEVATVVGPA